MIAVGGDIPEWLKEPAKAALAALAAAGGLITFVAAVGGAIVWVRYYSAELPADQALAALPQGELVASGAVMLAAFLLLGSLAAIGVYLFRDDESLTRGVGVGLLALVTAEGLVVVLLDVDSSLERRLVAAEVIALCAVLYFAVWRWQEKVGREASSSVAPSWKLIARIAAVVLAAAVVPVLVIAIDGSVDGWLIGLGAVLLLVGAIMAVLWVKEGTARIVGDPPGAPATTPYWVPFRAEPPPPAAEVDRLVRVSVLVRAAIAAVAVAVPALILHEKWLAASLAAAALLGFVVAQLAKRGGYNYFWYGAAVFVSVPLLGAVVGITRNIEDPQVQPVALIRGDDGPDRALQGIYVTETDDRVYFATIATEECTEELVPNSGRLLWVARKDIVTMSLGAPQAVEEAGTKALEMYHALAPQAALTAATGKQAVAHLKVASGSDADTPTEPPKRRLEDVGPALRREFKAQRLDSVVAEEGVGVNEEVTLTGRGFGKQTVDGVTRAVRIGPVEAEVVEGGWRKNRITFKVPPGAKSGLVTIECRPLATQPYLRVRHAPRAKLDVTLIAKSATIAFDSSRSEDPGGDIRRRSWRVSGPGVDGDRTATAGIRHRRDLGSSRAPYKVSLRVRDSDGQSSAATAWLWRPPPDRVDDGRSLARGFETVRRELARDKVKAIVYGHARAGDKAARRKASAALARKVSTRLSDGDPALERKLSEAAFGDRCVAAAGARRRVDVLVLPKGSKVTLPQACKALRVTVVPRS